MRGAREYAELFKTGQYGRFYIRSDSHARGKTFDIYLLPVGYCSKSDIVPFDAVEIYGIIDGQPGWTESYGWLHHGKWEEDFAELVEEQKRKVEEQKQQQALKKQASMIQEMERIQKLLANY